MGMGLSMICPECKKEYSFSFGCGALFFQNHTKHVLYYCPKCGCWENKEIQINKMFRESEEEPEETLIEKRHILSCSKCKTRMRKMEDFNSDKLPLLICKKCNAELKYNSTYCWD